MAMLRASIPRDCAGTTRTRWTRSEAFEVVSDAWSPGWLGQEVRVQLHLDGPGP